MTKQSRFEKITKKRSQKNIALILSGTIIIIIIFFFYGIPILVNFSLFLMNFNNQNTEQSYSQYNSYLTAPILDPLPDATNSARINVSGNASSAQTVKIYLNNKYLKQTETDKEQNFLFKNIVLREGNNEIKIKAQNSDNKESDYSQLTRITYINKPPALQIDFPQDGQSFSGNNQITIKGKSDSNVRITANNFWVIVDNAGNFSYLIKLLQGENKIQIIAIDEAGNQTAKELKVIYNP